MDVDNMGDDLEINLDLNLEPVGPVAELEPLLNELETAHGRIEDRIRQLEEVTARARQRQRWRRAQNPRPETSNIIAFESTGFVGTGSGEHNGEDSLFGLDRAVERGKSCKRDNTYLVAKALAMDLDVKKEGDDGGSFYDCNICLDMAKEPILTCCGHLFCWACFYQLPYIDSTAKECPVCKGEVIDDGITPVYGNGDTTHVSESEMGTKIPPRPKAHRIESVRQQRVNRRISHIPVAEALRRIRIGIGATVEQHQPQQQDLDGTSVGSDTNTQVYNAEARGSRRLHSHQFSRVLSDSAASLSSISSALNNAERLVEDLETYIHRRILRRTDSEYIPNDGRDPFSSNVAVIQSELQAADSITENNPVVPFPSSSRRANASGSIFPLETPDSDTTAADILMLPRPSSSRRRSGASRVSDVDSGVSRESRRRRLR